MGSLCWFWGILFAKLFIMLSATQLRSLNGNLGLAFQIGESRLEPDELKNFTREELQQFLHRATRQEIKDEIVKLLTNVN